MGLKRYLFTPESACYGHFGRKDPDFTWEKTDKVKEILEYANKLS